jgi:hypothetical protein
MRHGPAEDNVLENDSVKLGPVLVTSEPLRPDHVCVGE